MTEQIILETILGLAIMPVLGLMGAVFLQWSALILDNSEIHYWLSYRITTFGSMACVLLMLPAQFFLAHAGPVKLILLTGISILLFALILSYWVRDARDRPIGLERGLWISFGQSALILLVAGIAFALPMLAAPKRMLIALGVIVFFTALLIYAAAAARRKRAELHEKAARKQQGPQQVAIDQGEMAQLRLFVIDEISGGKTDAALWALAGQGIDDAVVQHRRYVDLRVAQLREIAEEQLRKEGFAVRPN